MHHLSRQDARRLAVSAQALTADRLPDLMAVARRLTVLQLDPARPVGAPSAQLVAWSRLGSAYDPAELDDALDRLELVDLTGFARPAEDIALFYAEMAAWPGVDAPAWRIAQEGWIAANAECHADILERLRQDGPLPASELPDTCAVPWRSSGWNNNRNVRMLLDLMVERGEIATAGHDGRERLWDLASRIYPDLPAVPPDEADRTLRERRLQALGIARARAAKAPTEPNDVGDVGEEAVVDGVRGTWRVDPTLLDQPFTGRTAILSPLDRLLIDRKRMVELFEFDYQLEMFKPAAKRRWGYWAMPVLYADRLVGKVDATADVGSGVLRVDAVHQDEPFDTAMAGEVQQEIEDLAQWLELDLKMSEPVGTDA
ncbi:hypothetical protein FB467_0370 [Ornithinicoccus hortensis]|uniref:Winged helix-turn-helix domain-containing protein n=1 Tax=Ornithinicoccus hortensis TaxID=82346 RepID=A0A542YMI4_9MICO|nr:hypothetical protein FB467_0370 [Ornithinicoccus hortensis]